MKRLLLKSILLLCALVVGTSAWAQGDYSATYTSNVTLPSSGTNVSSCIVTINSTDYTGTKLGKSGAGASATITAPAGTKYIHLHVAAWNTKSPGFTYKVGTASAVSISGITTNSGIANSSPFTFSGDASSTNYYKVITLTDPLESATTITLASTGERVVIWGVNTEEASSDPSISASNVNIAYNATSGSIGYTISNSVVGGTLTAARTAGDWLTVGEVGASSVAFTCSANTGSQRTATVRLTYTYNTDKTVTKNVTITQALAPQTYTLASSLTSGKTYVIASGTSGSVKIMGAQTDNNRGTVDGTVSETTLTTENAPAEVVVYGPDASGYYTLYTTNGYLYAAGSGKNYLRSQTTNNLEGKWDIEINDGTKAATIEAQGSNSNNSFRYNSGSTVFSCYGSGQSPVYFFEKADAAVATTASVTLNGSGYATFATTTALDFLDADDASFSAWEITAISGSTITFSQIKKHVAAGKGILLKGTAGATINLNILPVGGDVLTSNKLVGITEATAVADDTYYGLKGNLFKMVGAGTVPGGKALLPASLVSSARELQFVFEENETTGVENVNRETITNNQFFDLSGRKVANPTKGLYIVNGKKVVIK